MNVVLTEQLNNLIHVHLLWQIVFFCENGDFHMQGAQLASCLSRHTWCWCELFGKKWFLIEKSALCQTNVFSAPSLWSLRNWRVRPVPFLWRCSCWRSLFHTPSLSPQCRFAIKGHINVVWPPKMRLDQHWFYCPHYKTLYSQDNQSQVMEQITCVQTSTISRLHAGYGTD